MSVSSVQLFEVCDCAFAGLLKVGCVCAMILMQSPDAGAAGVACRLKELTAHTKSLLEDSLRCFVSKRHRDLAEERGPHTSSAVQCRRDSMCHVEVNITM